VFNLFGGAISWMSKRQVVVALSTTEVEYMAATHASKEAVWLQRLCSGIGLVQQAVRIDCDNQSAIFRRRTQLIIQRQSILIFNITL
jgi:phosphoribosyl-AMP cyclohydrolase